MVKSVGKKLVIGGGQSKCLEAKLAELQAEIENKEASAAPSPAIIAARGFVPRTEETELEKKEAREWDRSSLLQVKDDDAQVKIYNDLNRGPNNTGGDRPTRFGLGFGSAEPGAEAKPAAAGPVKTIGNMRFVSSALQAEGAQPQPQPHNQAPGGSAPCATGTIAPTVPSEWTGPHTTPDGGNRYWYNTRTGVSQWTPPPEPLVAPVPADAQPEWTGPHTTPDGNRYWYNTRTGVSEWVQQAAQQPQPALAAWGSYPPHAGHAQPYAPTAALVPAPTRPPGKPGCTLAVSGLPPGMQDADVRELFGVYGSVTGLQLDRGSYSVGSTPRQGFITFDGSVGAASAARNMHGKVMRQHTLQVVVAEADDRPAASQPPATHGGAMRTGVVPSLAHRYQPY